MNVQRNRYSWCACSHPPFGHGCPTVVAAPAIRTEIVGTTDTGFQEGSCGDFRLLHDWRISLYRGSMLGTLDACREIVTSEAAAEAMKTD